MVWFGFSGTSRGSAGTTQSVGVEGQLSADAVHFSTCKWTFIEEWSVSAATALNCNDTASPTAAQQNKKELRTQKELNNIKLVLKMRTKINQKLWTTF